MYRVFTAACLWLVACGPPPARMADRFYFDPSWISEIHIELAPEDFEVLRHQERDFDDVLCAKTPPPNPYTYFPADITIDGITVHDVGVRKKGFFGSVVSDRPSFKVSFNHYVRGQRFFGMRRMTLNNSVSDPSKIKQCLGYELFAAGGVPAPRCSFAHVMVNDEDLDLYVNLEAIKTELLDRYFEDTSGNLYEGALSDFQPNDWIGTFQRKTNLENPDRSDLERVMEAAQAPDEELVTSLQEVIALDQFFDFWAMEVLIAHWDGYASRNHNNFYIYNNPKTGRFHFIPWGIDGILFDPVEADLADVRSAYAEAVLPFRLYRNIPTRDIYLERIREKIGEVWDEGRILSRIDEMEELITPYADPYGLSQLTEPPPGSLTELIKNVRHFVRTYPQLILDEIDAGPVVFPSNELAPPPCLRVVASPVLVEFDTTWGSLGAPDPFAAGTGTWQMTWTPEEGAPYLEIASQVAAAAGINPDSNKPTLIVVGVLPEGRTAFALIEFPDAAAVAPGTFEIGIGGELFALAVLDDPDPVVEQQLFFLDGELVLDEATAAADAAVIGSISADLRETGW